MTKHIAILTSGGDCAGLNAVLCAVVRRASDLGWKVTGIENGTAGLLEKPVAAKVLKPDDFDGFMMRRGGTLLGTTNSKNPFRYPMENGQEVDRSDEVIKAFKKLRLMR